MAYERGCGGGPSRPGIFFFTGSLGLFVKGEIPARIQKRAYWLRSASTFYLCISDTALGTLEAWRPNLKVKFTVRTGEIFLHV